MPFTGKNIVITGGTIGIGHEIIKQMLEHGAKNVAILDINDTNGATAKLQAQYPNGQTVIYLKTDVSDRENVWSSFREAHARFGRIDVVIGNAGFGDENKPELTIRINLLGVVNSTQAAVEFMGKPNGGEGGLVVNVASVSGLDPIGGLAFYGSTKFGVIGLTRSYATDTYKKLGIKFVVVCPAFVNTNLVANLLTEKLQPNVSPKAIARITEVMGVQTVEEVGVGFLQILKNPKETVYAIDAGIVRPVSIPDFWKRF